MKKIFLLIVLFLLVGLVGGVLAQERQEPVLLASEVLPELPNPGLKPGDFFYFLDEWAEALREFITFNPEAKALLQTERVLERIAEIKALLETKGVDAPGLAIAQEKIQANMAKAVKILEQQRAEGKIVSQLAKKLDDEFDARQELLKQTFKTEEAKLDARKEGIKLQILEARMTGDFGKITELRAILADIQVQKDKLEDQEKFQEKLLDSEEEKLEAQLEVKEKEFEDLAEDAEDLFEQKERDLKRAFKQKEKALELQERALEVQLKQAISAGDTELASQIRAKFKDLDDREENLDEQEETAKEDLKHKKKKLEMVVGAKDRAEDQIKEAKEEIKDVKEEILEFFEVPIVVSELVSEAEIKLATAEQAFGEEKYGEAFGQSMAAEMLARNAERILEEDEKVLEEMEELEGELEEVEQSEEKFKEVQEKLEKATHEDREELEEELEESRKEHEEKLREVEKVREKVKESEREHE